MEGFLGAIFKKQWHRIALTRSIALIPSMLVAVLAVDHFDTMGEFLNVLQRYNFHVKTKLRCLTKSLHIVYVFLQLLYLF